MSFVGGIYRIDPMDVGTPSALVLVTGFDQSTQSLSVTLLSPDMELAGSARPSPLIRHETGLAHRVSAESDIFGYAWVAQINTVRGELGRAYRWCARLFGCSPQ